MGRGGTLERRFGVWWEREGGLGDRPVLGVAPGPFRAAAVPVNAWMER